MTAVDWLHQFDPDASRQDIHGLLGQMLFSGEEGLKPTEALSGGETARLLFCRIMLQKPNVLVLDEPTNHLDLESINALNIALQKFEGTVLLVTHDQDLMEEVGTRVWHFDHGKDHRTSRAPTRRTRGRWRPAADRDGPITHGSLPLIPPGLAGGGARARVQSVTTCRARASAAASVTTARTRVASGASQ